MMISITDRARMREGIAYAANVLEDRAGAIVELACSQTHDYLGAMQVCDQAERQLLILRKYIWSLARDEDVTQLP